MKPSNVESRLEGKKKNNPALFFRDRKKVHPKKKALLATEKAIDDTRCPLSLQAVEMDTKGSSDGSFVSDQPERKGNMGFSGVEEADFEEIRI